MKKLYILIALLVVSIATNAQRFPIRVIPAVNPPAPVNFYSYADGSTLNSPLRVQLLLGDLGITNRQIRLKVYFEGNGISFEGVDNVLGASPLFIDGGTPLVLSNAELAPYFELQNLQGISSRVYGQTIPEGSYQFCFEVYDVVRGIQLGAKTCATTFIFKNEPPILNLPLNQSNIEPRPVDNIVFQWTPRHINVSNVEYEFSLVEIWDNTVDPQTAFLSSPPVFQTTTRATSFVYGPAQPLLLGDKRYAWQVRARALKGAEEIGLFRNDGKSEIFWFSKTEPCNTPKNVYAEPKGLSKMNVFWDEEPGIYTEYMIAYREKDRKNSRWFTKRTNAGWATVWDLKPNTTYEYKVRGKCQFQYSAYTRAQELTTASAEDETANYNCGIVPDVIAITNREGHPNLLIGDRITAGDFVVTITDITSEQNGVISGSGYVRVPYFEMARFGVVFNNILINTEYQLAEGEIVTLYDPAFGEDAQMEVEINIPEQEPEVTDQEGLENEIDVTVVEQTETTTNTEQNQNTNSNNTEENTSNDEEPDSENVTSEDPPIDDTTITDPPVTDTGDTPEGATESEEIAIKYNDTNYKNGDVIEISFDRDLPKQKFELIGAKENSKVDWAIFNTMEIQEASSALGDGKEVDLDLISNYSDELVLGAEYWKSENDFPNGKSKEIRVVIKIIKKEFNFLELTVTHKKEPKRVAKSDKTLYLINAKSLNDSKKEVRYDVELDPNFELKNIDTDNISWYYDKVGVSSDTPKNEGEKAITRNLVESIDRITTSVKAGYPNTSEKSVNVKWVEQYEVSTDYLSKFDKVLTFLEQFNRINDKFSKVLPCSGSALRNISALVGAKKVAFKLRSYNEEDKESRELYDVLQTNIKLQSSDLAKIECGKDIGYLGVSIGKFYGAMSLGAAIDFKYSLKTKNESLEQKVVPQVSGGFVLTTDFGFKTNEILDEYFYAKLAFEVKSGTKTVYPYNGKNYLIGNYFYVGKTNFVVEGYIDTWLTGRENFNFKFLVLDTYWETEQRLIFDIKNNEIYLNKK